MIGAFETTFVPDHLTDVSELTGHASQWRADVDRMANAGISRMRFALRWHRIEERPGTFDWESTDEQLAYVRAKGISPIIDLVHHTSYPAWLDDGFRDARFGDAYLRYAEAVATRYPWIESYTLFNEPFATLFLAGHEALWPPYDSGMDGFVRLLLNVLPAIVDAHAIFRRLLPDAEHVWIDTGEQHGGTAGSPAEYAALANDRRHVVLDLMLHHDRDPERPFLRQLIRHGGASLLSLDAISVDVLGVDYYCHSEWWYDEAGSYSPSPHPAGLAIVLEHYWQRYRIPLILGETNIRGLPSDRASWLKYTLEQYELAESHGVRLQGFCWFPYVDSSDWDSLLARAAGRTDPVGVVTVSGRAGRKPTCFTTVWEAAVRGIPTRDLPAYRFQSPCREQLSGLSGQMEHWIWQDPPEESLVSPVFVSREMGVDSAEQHVA
jgi:beta-glucosidase/6-phospho-beta-glucosidase/beta-galactosidase